MICNIEINAKIDNKFTVNISETLSAVPKRLSPTKAAFVNVKRKPITPPASWPTLLDIIAYIPPPPILPLVQRAIIESVVTVVITVAINI